MPDERPLRYCDLCGGLDDHPRHVRQLGKTDPDHKLPAGLLDRIQAAGNVNVPALVQLANPRNLVRHMDCCAAAGCDICQATERENGARRGQALVDHLTARRAAKEG